MASRAPTPLRVDRWVELALAATAGTLAVLAFVPAADAQVFGRRQAPEDWSAARPALPAPVVATGSIFQAADGYGALHEGWRARRVGDPLTIVLVERTAATKSAGSKLDSDGGFGIRPPTTGPLSLFDPTDVRAGGNRNFTGAGQTNQANSLTGEVSVTVAEVYPNGTMLVRGEKRVTLNRGDEFVRIKGVVRMADVDANNRVPSNRVADARIGYTGKGDVARAGRQGWLSRFFQVVSPF